MRIRFVKKAHLSRTPTSGVKTPIGEMRISTPQATALDLLRYPEHCGGLSNVATVLQELGERIDGGELVRVAEADGEAPYAQRLGYLLDRAGRQEVARALAEWVDARAPRVAPLSPGAPITVTPRDARWRVAVNAEVEVEATASDIIAWRQLAPGADDGMVEQALVLSRALIGISRIRSPGGRPSRTVASGSRRCGSSQGSWNCRRPSVWRLEPSGRRP